MPLEQLLILDTPERWHVNLTTNVQFIQEAYEQGVDGLSLFTISLKKPFGDCPQGDEAFSIFQNNNPWEPFDQGKIDQLAYLLDQLYEKFDIVRIVLFEEEIDTANYFNDSKRFNEQNSRWRYVEKILDLLNGRRAIITWEECTWPLEEIKKYLIWLDGKIDKSTQTIALHNPNAPGELERLFGGLINTPLQLAEVQVTNSNDIVPKVQWLRTNCPNLRVIVAEYPNLDYQVIADGVYFFYAPLDQTLSDLNQFNEWFHTARRTLFKQQRHIRAYLLGLHANAYKLDTNNDGRIDYADGALP